MSQEAGRRDADELAEIVRCLTRFWRKNPHARAAIADRSDNLRVMLDRLVELPRALTERTTTQPLLPPSLRSVDDVRRACEAAGFSETRTHAWREDGIVDVLTGPAFRDGGCIVICHSAPWSVELRGGTPTSLLLAAIRSAREETP